MKELLDKLSSYNIFNYLLPGVVFVSLSKSVTGYDLVQENLLVGVFVYYFIGMVISRIGSIVIEPLLKKSRIIRFADYEKYVIAAKKDEKIELLSEVNNTYRTIVSLALILVCIRGYRALELSAGFNEAVSIYLLCVFLFILFILAHRKQTSYVRQRVEIAAKSSDKKQENN